MDKSFTSKQKEIVARKMGYDGPMQGFDDFLASSPSDAQKYSAITSKFVERMAKGGMVKKYQEGGVVTASPTDATTGAPIIPGATSYTAAQTATPTPIVTPTTGVTTTATPAQVAQATDIAAPDVIKAPTIVAAGAADEIKTALEGGVTKNPLPQTSDVMTALRMSQGKEQATPDALKKYDWNRDGKIDFSDMSNVLKMQLGKPTTIPMPDDMDWGKEVKTEGVSAAQGAVSEGSLAQAAQGEVSAESLAEQQQFNDEYKRLVAAEQRTTEEGEMVTAVTDVPTITSQAAQAAAPTAVQAAQGQVQADQLVKAAQIAESDMAQATAITADGLAPDAKMVAAKLDKFTVDDGTLAQAAQGNVDALSTVQGQLSQLMQSFNDGSTPAWAAGAIRGANAAMAARGLGGSSMAATAIFQAAMESALPIAAHDAQVFQQMGMQNLNNRQQVALANAAAQQGLSLQNLSNEQQARLTNATNSFALQSQNLSNMQQTMLANTQIRATLQGQNLSNQQQAAVLNAARYAEQANINLNNLQQAALHNSSMQVQVDISNASNRQQTALANAQIEAAMQGKVLDNKQQAAVLNAARISENLNTTFNAAQQAALSNSQLMKDIGIANLSAAQQTTIANAATIASMDMANLNARQQTAVQNAQAFLATDLKNLDNQQQMAIFKAKAITDTLLSDTAAENAAKITNASNELEAAKISETLRLTANQFNASEKNKISLANMDAANELVKFNAQEANDRAEFNSRMSAEINVANAKILADVSTANTAAVNAANAVNAKNATDLSASAYAQQSQTYRDLLSYSWKTGESTKDRFTNLAIASVQKDVANIKADSESSSALGRFATEIAKNTTLSDIEKGYNFIKGLF